MFRFIRQGRRRRKMKKVKEGDGHLLKRYRIWNIFTHSLLHMEITNEMGEKTYYAIKSRYFTEEASVDLYHNGRHIAFSKLPAAFPVVNGVIEIKNNSYGINRILYFSDEKETYSIYPDKRSIRGFRMLVHKRFPKFSSFIAIMAIIILLLSIALSLPQLMETLSKIPWVADNIGTFVSPITLSVWTNFAIGIAAALAGTERAFMLRRHWLIDIETMNWGED
ncbi:hypothetical protein [Oceanobacillus kapialis]|uniref:hypothetical protein n=1 Tax=Oceanobacillus kapialis TaxID=481353 RepID=UPI0038506A64